MLWPWLLGESPREQHQRVGETHANSPSGTTGPSCSKVRTVNILWSDHTDDFDIRRYHEKLKQHQSSPCYTASLFREAPTGLPHVTGLHGTSINYQQSGMKQNFPLFRLPQCIILTHDKLCESIAHNVFLPFTKLWPYKRPSQVYSKLHSCREPLQQTRTKCLSFKLVFVWIWLG